VGLSCSLTPKSSLAMALSAYGNHLLASSYSEHTVKAFLYDLKLLGRFLGLNKPIGQISTADLNGWLTYLREERGRPCSPKSLSRRVTAIKNFFRWLTKEGVIASDPAARVIYKRADSPLPKILFETECQQLLKAARKYSRAYLLILLLLETGIKKEEVLGIRLTDIDLSNPYQPEVLIQHPAGRRAKDRKLRLPPDFLAAYRRYLKEYKPRTYLFECSYRLLNDILAEAVRRAGIKKRATLQGLRDTFAVRQLRAGVNPEEVMRKLGLAPGTWPEAIERYQKLAMPAL